MIDKKNRAAYRLFLKWEHRVNNEESRKAFVDRYRGEWDTEAAYAEHRYEASYDMDELPEWARGHVDWPSIAKEMFSTDFYGIDSTHGWVGFVHVFSNN